MKRAQLCVRSFSFKQFKRSKATRTIINLMGLLLHLTLEPYTHQVCLAVDAAERAMGSVNSSIVFHPRSTKVLSRFLCNLPMMSRDIICGKLMFCSASTAKFLLHPCVYCNTFSDPQTSLLAPSSG